MAVLGKEKKLLALAKADRGFVGQRHLSGQEGDINASSGKGGLDKRDWKNRPKYVIIVLRVVTRNKYDVGFMFFFFFLFIKTCQINMMLY